MPDYKKRKRLLCRLNWHKKPYGVQRVGTNMLEYCSYCGAYIDEVLAFEVIKRDILTQEANDLQLSSVWRDRYVQAWSCYGKLSGGAMHPRPLGFVGDQEIERRVKRGKDLTNV